MDQVTARGCCGRAPHRRIRAGARRAFSAGGTAGASRSPHGSRSEACNRKRANRMPVPLVCGHMEAASRCGHRHHFEQAPRGPAHAAGGAGSGSWSPALDAASNDHARRPRSACRSRGFSELLGRRAWGQRNGGWRRRMRGDLGTVSLRRLRFKRNAVVPSTDRRPHRLTTSRLRGLFHSIYAMPG